MSVTNIPRAAAILLCAAAWVRLGYSSLQPGPLNLWSNAEDLAQCDCSDTSLWRVSDGTIFRVCSSETASVLVRYGERGERSITARANVVLGAPRAVEVARSHQLTRAPPRTSSPKTAGPDYPQPSWRCPDEQGPAPCPTKRMSSDVTTSGAVREYRHVHGGVGVCAARAGDGA